MDSGDLPTLTKSLLVRRTCETVQQFDFKNDCGIITHIYRHFVHGSAIKVKNRTKFMTIVVKSKYCGASSSEIVRNKKRSISLGLYVYFVRTDQKPHRDVARERHGRLPNSGNPRRSSLADRRSYRQRQFNVTNNRFAPEASPNSTSLSSF